MAALSPNDPSSFSRPEYAINRHVSLTLDVDFEKKVLYGTAVLQFEALQNVDEVVLDVRDQTIQAVELDSGEPLKYSIDSYIPNFGSKLTITLPALIAPPQKTHHQQVDSKDKMSAHDYPGKSSTDPTCLYKYLSKSRTEHVEQKKSETISHNTGSNISSCTCSTLSTKSSIGQRISKVWHDIKCIGRKSHSHEPPKIDVDAFDDIKDEKMDDIYDVDSLTVIHDPRFSIRIKYETSPNATALQWLDPSQTSGKTHPYMFSQCQPIHARSILPCQDTPAVKFTYDAEVQAPEPYTVLMSALRRGTKGNKTMFEQPVPIPSYLLAVAVGVLEHKILGPRSIVWAEKAEIGRSAWEFADTEKYLAAAERLCGPYVWGQYDLLVLPPSFPYGGMENPCLTFVTPTLLAGDKSQAEVIVHEIMHSWSGNLVTIKNFEHFWLNEGFTVYLERKVTASLVEDPVDAKKLRDFQSRLGLQELSESVHEQFHKTHPLTKLVPDLQGVHPDDAFSRVPYEKGSLFLRYLEDLCGGPEIFDEFIRSYLQHFKRKSLDTDQFKAYLFKFFKNSSVQEKLQRVNWQAWLYEPGMPPTIPHYDTSMSEAVTKLVAKIKKEDHEINATDIKGFNTHQIIHLLQELIDSPPLTIDKLETLGKEYNLLQNHNSEIRYRWLRMCVRSRNSDRLPEAFEFINNQGRMKYIRPIYRDLYAWEDVRERAIKNFLDNEANMMHVAAYTVRKDLHLQQQQKQHE